MVDKIQKSWDDAKTLLKNQGLNDSDPSYWDKVAGTVTQGAELPSEGSYGPAPSVDSIPQNNNPGISSNRTITQSPTGSMFGPGQKEIKPFDGRYDKRYESFVYKTLEEEMAEFQEIAVEAEKKTIPENAIEMAKELKAKNLPDEEIINSLVNRLSISYEEAEEILNGEDLSRFEPVIPTNQHNPPSEDEEKVSPEIPQAVVIAIQTQNEAPKQ